MGCNKKSIWEILLHFESAIAATYIPCERVKLHIQPKLKKKKNIPGLSNQTITWSLVASLCTRNRWFAVNEQSKLLMKWPHLLGWRAARFKIDNLPLEALSLLRLYLCHCWLLSPLVGLRGWEEVLPKLKISTSFFVSDHDSWTKLWSFILTASFQGLFSESSLNLSHPPLVTRL